ncbi:MAG TPA: hypothetical protein VFV39_03095, partial [Limnobacter sp.]|nr:hypothetical protein [Limnobacter sp.]
MCRVQLSMLQAPAHAAIVQLGQSVSMYTTLCSETIAMTKQILRLCALFTASALLPAALHAQTANSNFAQESELNACLVLEKEGLQRFNALETRATELRGVDSLLRNRREALVKSRQHMDAKRPGSQEVARFNADVATFNQQTDQLNADKAA